MIIDKDGGHMLKLFTKICVRMPFIMNYVTGDGTMYKKIADEIIANRKNYNVDNAKEAADKLLSVGGLRKIPVEIISLCRNLGFSVFVQNMPRADICGYILIDGELKDSFQTDRIISVNRNESPKRRRFTVAHELAHYLFEFNPTECIEFYNAFELDHSFQETEEERRANRFAAELLMPQNEFIKEYKEIATTGISFFDSVQKLSDTFLVPPKAVSLRIKEELHLA